MESLMWEKRLKQTGSYSKSEKYNLLFAISGDPDLELKRWCDIWSGEGTTGHRMIDFVQTIVTEHVIIVPNRRFCFIMDNLQSRQN